MLPVVSALEHVAVGLELLGFDEPPCGDPGEGVPPQQRLERLHDDALDRVAVGDVARFMAQDGLHLLRGGLLPDVDRVQERERGDTLRGMHQGVARRAYDLGTSFQAADAENLYGHQTEQEQRAECPDGMDEPFGRHGLRRRGCRDCCRDEPLHRCCGGGDRNHLAGPYGNPQQRDDGGEQGGCEQVDPTPAEADPLLEQQRVYDLQDAAAYGDFEHIGGEVSHGGCFWV